MEPPSLIVSNPPHDEVDHAAAAELLGLTTAEARLKANFSAPEIWMSFADPGGANDAATALRSTGLRVAVVHGAALVGLPWPAPATAIAFEDDALVAWLDEERVELPYDVDVLGVYCRPPTDFPTGEFAARATAGSARTSFGQRSTTAFVERLVGRGSDRSRLAVAEALERATTLDLYARADGALTRVAIAQGVTDFAGLGEARRQRASDNMAECVACCERRFERLVLDARLVNVRPRQRLPIGGEAPASPEGRKLYSFGTRGLREVLESISPEVADVTQQELGCRLSYVLNGIRPGA